MILNILLEFAFEHIERIYVSDVSGKAFPRNCSLKIDRNLSFILKAVILLIQVHLHLYICTVLDFPFAHAFTICLE